MSSEQLDASDEIIKTAQAVKPDTKELEAIRSFCADEVKRRNENAEITESLKLLRKTQKALKSELQESLKALKDTKCAALSKTDLERLDTEASKAGLASMPPFVRLLQTNKDASINAEVIQEALESVSSEDLREASETSESSSQVILNLILTNIRRLIRSYSESIKLVPNLPRGMTLYETEEAPTALANKMFELWTTEQKIKAALDLKKSNEGSSRQNAAHKEKIESFFIRTGLTAQRLVVEGKTYRLIRRISVRKPKIGIGKLESILEEVSQSEDFRNNSIFKPSDWIRAIQMQLSSLPPETKSTIALCSVKTAKEE